MLQPSSSPAALTLGLLLADGILALVKGVRVEVLDVAMRGRAAWGGDGGGQQQERRIYRSGVRVYTALGVDHVCSGFRSKCQSRFSRLLEVKDRSWSSDCRARRRSRSTSASS